MSKIKLLENIPGYPLIIPESTCPADALKDILRNVLDRDDVISTSVELSDRFHSTELHHALDDMGFIVDEREWHFSCDLLHWSGCERLFRSGDYDFLNYERTGVTPFVEVARGVSSNDHFKTKEGIRILQDESFNPRLWEVAYYHDRPVGMYMCKIDQNGVGRLDFMAVIDEHQKRGLGTKMHIQAMRMLKLYGAVSYEGSICVDNVGMLSILNRTECYVEGARLLYIK